MKITGKKSLVRKISPKKKNKQHKQHRIKAVPLNDDEVITTADGRTYTVAQLRSSHSITPKGDITWYIKWISSIIVLIAVTIRASGIPELHWIDVLGSWIGAVGWFVVGFMWKDRALILLNGVISVILLSGLLKILVG
jgi:hypothetical protein